MHIILALTAVVAQGPSATSAIQPTSLQNVTMAPVAVPDTTHSVTKEHSGLSVDPVTAMEDGRTTIRIQALLLLTLAGLCLAAAGAGAIFHPDGRFRYRPVLELLAGLFLFLGSWGLIFNDVCAGRSDRSEQKDSPPAAGNADRLVPTHVSKRSPLEG